jgi:putative Holliday junction resolvase
MPRYIAIDYGTKRIGLASADSAVGVTTPLGVVAGRNDLAADVDAVLAVVADYQVDTLVVGLPLNMDDTEGPQAKLTRRFGTLLAERSGLEVVYHDERLSSFAADDAMAGSDLTQQQRKRQRDKLAAAAILQAFLDQQTQG